MTMKKHINICSLAALGVYATALIGGLTACNKNENAIGTQELHLTLEAQFDEGDDAQTRAVSFGNDGATSTSTFATGDKIYIYNNTKSALEHNYLSVNDISADGKSATFTGSIAGTYEVGDQLTLYYNFTHFEQENYSNCKFEYSLTMTGSAENASAHDHAMAMTTVAAVSDGTLTLTAPVSLQKMQSLFRQRLTFTDKDGNTIATPNIANLTINSQDFTLSARYWAGSGDSYQTIIIKNPIIDSNGDIYLPLRFGAGSTSDDTLTLTAVDNQGICYIGTKSAPSGGFQNGKYYHGAMTLAWATVHVRPTITRNDGGTVPEPHGTYYRYDIYENESKPIDITVSGTSIGYYFWLNDPGDKTVRFNSINAVNSKSEFVYSQYGSINLVLSGDNTIACQRQGVYAYKDLKISGNGTLTVTVQYDYRKGLCGKNNYGEQYNYDASTLAADGYTVTCSDMTDNGDGTYTWTYTVAPNA